MTLTIHIDGGSRGNPGPAGAGIVIRGAGGRPILEAGYFLGTLTNNQAEYQALIRALDAAGTAGSSVLQIHADSQLLVRQINGQYRVKNPGLRPLFDRARRQLTEFDEWSIHHVRREFNEEADRLANLAMDERADVIELDRREAGPTSTTVSQPTSSPCREIVATCTTAAAAAICPAPCSVGATLLFDRTVPDGVCMGAARSLLDAIEAMGEDGETRTVRCRRKACGAEFDLEPKP